MTMQELLTIVIESYDTSTMGFETPEDLFLDEILRSDLDEICGDMLFTFILREIAETCEVSDSDSRTVRNALTVLETIERNVRLTRRGLEERITCKQCGTLPCCCEPNEGVSYG